MEGESVVIPKYLNLLVDIDSSPILNAIDVEGSLIFLPHDKPDTMRTFDAHYIMVKGGYLEIGTEQFPYTSKLTITMHGTK
jgi:G8 domain